MIALIKAVFGALGAIFGYFKDRQLINAGRRNRPMKMLRLRSTPWLRLLCLLPTLARFAIPSK
jgi:hypothetical protein